MATAWQLARRKRSPSRCVFPVIIGGYCVAAAGGAVSRKLAIPAYQWRGGWRGVMRHAAQSAAGGGLVSPIGLYSASNIDWRGWRLY